MIKFVIIFSISVILMVIGGLFQYRKDQKLAKMDKLELTILIGKKKRKITILWVLAFLVPLLVILLDAVVNFLESSIARNLCVIILLVIGGLLGYGNVRYFILKRILKTK